MFNGYYKALIKARDAFNSDLNDPQYIKAREYMFRHKGSTGNSIPQFINEFGPGWLTSFLSNFIRPQNQKMMEHLLIYDIAIVRLGYKYKKKHGISPGYLSKEVIRSIKLGKWNEIRQLISKSEYISSGKINLEVAGYPYIPEILQLPHENTQELRVYPFYMDIDTKIQIRYPQLNHKECIKKIQSKSKFVMTLSNLLVYPLSTGHVC